MKGRATRSKPRSPGRPTEDSDADVRAALMVAARKLFLQYGFAKVTARQIAAAAGTTAAMIHYYFENKEGLFRAMLQEAIAPIHQMLVDVLRPDTGVPDFGKMIGAQLRMVAANPWIATLIVNEVLAEGGQFRAVFMRDIAGRMLPMLVELLERERRAGRIREDLNPRLTALSLMSLNMFPFLTRVVTGPVLGVEFKGAALEELIEHTTRMFLNGISRTEASKNEI